jgi:hypothetical protein
MKEEKTSLERSHSTLSNTKLTFLCLLAALAFAALWCGIALLCYTAVPKAIGIPLTAVSGVVLCLCLFLAACFKR